MPDPIPWVASPCWVIEKHRDYAQFFSAVRQLELPEDARFSLEATRPGAEVAEFLKPYLVRTRQPGGIFKFLSSEIQYYSIPLNAETTARFAELVETHAAPEICNYLLAVRGEEVLLNWYDFPDDPIYVVGSVAEQSIRSFADALGSSYRFEE